MEIKNPHLPDKSWVIGQHLLNHKHNHHHPQYIFIFVFACVCVFVLVYLYLCISDTDDKCGVVDEEVCAASFIGARSSGNQGVVHIYCFHIYIATMYRIYHCQKDNHPVDDIHTYNASTYNAECFHVSNISLSKVLLSTHIASTYIASICIASTHILPPHILPPCVEYIIVKIISIALERCSWCHSSIG